MRTKEATFHVASATKKTGKVILPVFFACAIQLFEAAILNIAASYIYSL